MHPRFLLTSSIPHAHQQIMQFCAHHDIEIQSWLSDQHASAQAALIHASEKLSLSSLHPPAHTYQIDVNPYTQNNQLKKLLIADMDATIIRGESLDELAALCGRKDEIAAITARTMAGELDFQTGLDMRLSQLAGQPEAKLQQVIDNTIITDGAAVLIATLQAHHTPCYLVSGGFRFLTSHIASRLGFTGDYANQLGIEDGKLTGKALPPLIDKSSKEQILRQKCAEYGISADEAICVGDGANDAAMLSHAGLGVAFEGKPILKQATDTHLDFTDLTGLLYLQGLKSSSFVTA